ncbi:peptidase m61 domain containing protein [Paramyrothecium foliicola]|nr:peptidase m61 domain containing protein [Paramyrothecium foliicola]
MRIIQILVDLREARRGLIHVEVELPVQSATVATFTTPLWIQESHRDNGPVSNIAGLYFSSRGKSLRWRRNPKVASEFSVEVPPETETVHGVFDAIVTRKVTRRLVMLGWESVLLYPSHRDIRKLPIQARVTVPAGWAVGTALQNLGGVHRSDPDGSVETMTFRPTSLDRLADSPLLAGLNFDSFAITSDHKHMLCVAGDTRESVAIPKLTLDKLAVLVRQTQFVFGPRHYESFRFLVALTDYWQGYGGSEHHDSCDIFLPSKALLGVEMLEKYGPVLTHEFIHSWNGKYRRPAGHAPHDFATPLDGRLMWVYEGLTQYYDGVISVRSGMMSPLTYRAELAKSVAWLQGRAGRSWRSTEDTGTGASLRPSSAWESWARSGEDYYFEGVMIWLGVDTIIRSKSDGRRSLDDFARAFFGRCPGTVPKVVPYTLDEILCQLTTITPHDWGAFFEDKVLNPSPDVNIEAIERSGYRFSYKRESQGGKDSEESLRDSIWNSVGVKVASSGHLEDVRRGSPADIAKLAPRQTITAIGGEAFDLKALAVAINSAGEDGDDPIKLTMTQDGDEWLVDIYYMQGLRYPWLEPVPGTLDMLSSILTPTPS